MSDRFKFKYDLYRHRFKQPLRTSHGIWREREGIIISLEDSTGRVALGEIAPLPWFGSETLAQAVSFCRQLAEKLETISGKNITSDAIAKIPDYLPACQFALETAWLNLAKPPELNGGLGNLGKDKGKDRESDINLNYCYLLPAGEKALDSWQKIYQAQGNSTFKWKIGVYPLTTEIEILKQLIKDFPAHVKLRLDANGGLNQTQAKTLLAVTDSLDAIEFIEQPLPCEHFAQILQLSKEHTTLLALDESVASFKQLHDVYHQGWPGVFVIKAAIMGFPSRLQKFCKTNSLDVVFSSVLETEVGRRAVLNLVQKLDHPRAVGYGVALSQETKSVTEGEID